MDGAVGVVHCLACDYGYFFDERDGICWDGCPADMIAHAEDPVDCVPVDYYGEDDVENRNATCAMVFGDAQLSEDE